MEGPWGGVLMSKKERDRLEVLGVERAGRCQSCGGSGSDGISQG